MRILLIWPYFGGDKAIEYVPLALAYLKANLDPTAHEVRILDTVLEDLPPDSEAFVRATEGFDFDLVGFSCTSNKFANTVKYARQIKARYPDIPIVVGGVHVTCYPDETMRFGCFDYGFVGEAEFAFPRFLAALQSGADLAGAPGLCFRTPAGMQRNAPDRPQDLDSICTPDYRDISLGRYYDRGYQFIYDKMDHAPIWISRGCPYTCRFCASPTLNGRRMRYHSPDYVEAFIRKLHGDLGVNHVNIIDDNFTFEMDKAKDHLRRLIALRREIPTLTFAFPNGVRMQRVDEELLRLMKDAGFTYVVFAPESGSPTILKRMQKGLTPDIIAPAIRLAHAAGLKVMSFWVVGFPGETVETLEETRRVILDCGADLVSLHAFAALPGTSIFEQLVAEGKLSRDYLPDSYQRIGENDYVADGLTRQDLAEFTQTVYFQHYVERPWNALSHLQITGPEQIPTLEILVDRELEILSFRPTPFWRIRGRFLAPDGGPGARPYEASWFDPSFPVDLDRPGAEDRVTGEGRLQELLEAVRGREGVAEETRWSRKESAPPLFDLTTLQREANRRFGMSARSTLAAAQRLYEVHKLVTYPRTESRCLPSGGPALVQAILGVLEGDESRDAEVGLDFPLYRRSARYLRIHGLENRARAFDDQEGGEPLAIIPTAERAPATLQEDEARVYDLIVRRFLAAFHPVATWVEVERVTRVVGHHFRTRSRHLADAGWREVYDGEVASDEGDLPALVPEQDRSTGVPARNLELDCVAGETQPPVRMSEGALLGLMEGSAQGVAGEGGPAKVLGTPGTRADIIEALIARQYVDRVDRALRTTAKGIRLIDTLRTTAGGFPADRLSDPTPGTP